MLATHADLEELFLEAGRRVVDIARRYYEKDDDSVLPRSICTKAAFENAMTLDIAMGGSTNTVLHILAAAIEAEVDFTMADIDRLSRTTPNICKVAPSSADYHVEHVRRAGGHPHPRGVQPGERSEALDLDRRGGCIRTVAEPYFADGRLAVLYGNIAVNGCIVKTAGVDPSILTFSGPARVFESQDSACAGILDEDDCIQTGDVIVIRYEGPKGGPGMQEMLYPTSYIKSRASERSARW